MTNEFELIITIVNRGFSDQVMDAARAAGARGGTIIYSRGTITEEMQTFFGVSIDPEKEVILILCAHDERSKLMNAISDAAGIKSECRGMSFSLPVDDAIGISLAHAGFENGDK